MSEIDFNEQCLRLLKESQNHSITDFEYKEVVRYLFSIGAINKNGNEYLISNKGEKLLNTRHFIKRIDKLKTDKRIQDHTNKIENYTLWTTIISGLSLLLSILSLLCKCSCT